MTCANCPVDTGTCPTCGTHWTRVEEQRIGHQVERPTGVVSMDEAEPTQEDRIVARVATVSEQMRRRAEAAETEVERLRKALTILRHACNYVPIKRHNRTPEQQQAVQAFTEAWCAVDELFDLPEPVRRTEAEVAAALGTSGRAEAYRAAFGVAESRGER